MTNTELMNLKAALEAKRLELAARFSGRIRETISKTASRI